VKVNDKLFKRGTEMKAVKKYIVTELQWSRNRIVLFKKDDDNGYVPEHIQTGSRISVAGTIST